MTLHGTLALCRPYLSTALREMFASYALPVAAIFMSFIGSYLFKKIKRERTC